MPVTRWQYNCAQMKERGDQQRVLYRRWAPGMSLARCHEQSWGTDGRTACRITRGVSVNCRPTRYLRTRSRHHVVSRSIRSRWCGNRREGWGGGGQTNLALSMDSLADWNAVKAGHNTAFSTKNRRSGSSVVRSVFRILSGITCSISTFKSVMSGSRELVVARGTRKGRRLPLSGHTARV